MKSTKSFSNTASVVFNIKRYWWFGVITFIMEFLLQPVLFWFALSSKLGGHYLDEETKLAQIKGFVDQFFMGTGEITAIHVFFVGLLGVLAGILFFCYVDSKRQIDLLHALPVSRTKLYLTAVVTALIYYVGALIVNMLLTIAVAGAMGVLGYVTAAGALSKLYYIIICYCVMFGITVFAGMLCGAIYAHMEITLLLLFGPLMVNILTTQLFDDFFSTYVYFGDATVYFSPFAHFVAGVGSKGLAVYAFAAVALIVVSLVLYKLRPSEKSGSPLVFGASFPFVRAIACYLASTLLGLLMRTAYNSLFALGFGMALGGLLCHMFCEAQYYRNASRMFKDMRWFFAFAAAMAVFIAVLALDVFGFDSYVPEKDNIKCVRLEYGYQDTQGILQSERTGSYIELQKQADDFLSLESPENIENAAEIARLIVDGKAFSNKNVFAQTNDVSLNSSIEKQKRRVKLTYTLKSGRTVRRQYDMADSLVIAQPLAEMLTSEEYVSKGYVAQQLELGEMPSMIVNVGMNSGKNYSINDEKTIRQVLTALDADMKNGSSPLFSPTTYMISVEQKRDSKLQSYQMAIYSCYEQTTALLRAQGWNPMVYETPQENADRLVRLEVFDTTPYQTPAAVFNDPEQIDKMLGNGFIQRENYDDRAITIMENYALYGYTAEECKLLDEARKNEPDDVKAREKAYYAGEYAGTDAMYDPDVYNVVYGQMPEDMKNALGK